MEDAPSAIDLLAEIQTESLHAFLASVRRETSPAGSTHIPALDTYLASVNARRTSNNWSLNRGDVIEIQGPAASGKTHLLYHMLLCCLMPARHRERDLGGWGKAAILCDADGSFSISRLYDLLHARLKRLLAFEDALDVDTAIEDLATQCLENLHVFRPTSSVQLAITLLHLPRYHSTDPRLQSLEIGLLAVDSLSAFYWRDRYTLEQLRDAADGSSNTTLPSNALLYVVQALQRFRSSHRPVILMCNWGLNALTALPSSGGDPTPLFYKQHLHPFPAPFEHHGASEAIENLENSQRRSFDADSGGDSLGGNRVPRRADPALPLHYHITLHPSPIDPFPASYSLTEAISQEGMRAEFVNKGEVWGAVRCPGDDDVGHFAFRICKREIFVDIPEPISEPDSDSRTSSRAFLRSNEG